MVEEEAVMMGPGDKKVINDLCADLLRERERADKADRERDELRERLLDAGAALQGAEAAEAAMREELTAAEQRASDLAGRVEVLHATLERAGVYISGPPRVVAMIDDVLAAAPGAGDAGEVEVGCEGGSIECAKRLLVVTLALKNVRAERDAVDSALDDFEDTQGDNHDGTLVERIFRIDQRALKWEEEASRLREAVRLADEMAGSALRAWLYPGVERVDDEVRAAITAYRAARQAGSGAGEGEKP